MKKLFDLHILIYANRFNALLIIALVFSFSATQSHAKAETPDEPCRSTKSSLCPINTDIKVALIPVVTGIDLVTDINVVDDYFYICTQPGLLLRKKMDSGSQTDAEVVLDLRKEVGTLGKNIPALPGLGYPVPGTYDERGLLGFAADPDFSHNGRYWVWYSSINDYTTPAPNFFQWLISTSTPWNQSEYDHIDHLVEYKKGSPPRTLLKLKRPYFNHTGYASVAWSPEHNTLLLALGDGGSENDPNALAQDNDQLSGKLIKINLTQLNGLDFTNSPPVATYSDLKQLNVPSGAFSTLLKGLRNPSKVTFEQITDHEDHSQWIKYLGNTGQDTLEFVHGFKEYGLNFGWRAWEGIFPDSFANSSETNSTIAYPYEALLLANFYRPFLVYGHSSVDPDLGANAGVGAALYKGNSIKGLKSGSMISTDYLDFNMTPMQGILLHTNVDRSNLQKVQQSNRFELNLNAVGLIEQDKTNNVLFFTAINTSNNKRIFIGGYKSFQYIINQNKSGTNFPNGLGGIYEVVDDN